MADKMSFLLLLLLLWGADADSSLLSHLPESISRDRTAKGHKLRPVRMTQSILCGIRGSFCDF